MNPVVMYPFHHDLAYFSQNRYIEGFEFMILRPKLKFPLEILQ